MFEKNKNYGGFPTIKGLDLEPCPFCGADAEIDEDVSGSGNFPTRYLASCSKCCGMIEEWWNTPEEAAAAWNGRTPHE